MFWYDLLFPPLMIVAPLLMTFLFRTPPTVEVDRPRLRRLYLWFALATALSLAVFAILYLAVSPEVSRHSWPLCFVGFALMIRLLAVKCPHLVVHSPQLTVRTASLVNRARTIPVPRSLFRLLWILWAAAVGGVLLRLAWPMDDGERVRWFCALGGAIVMVLNPILIPWAVCRCMDEPEPLDAAGSLELEQEYAANRRFRAWGFFWLGLTMTLVLGGAMAIVTWIPQDGASGALIGGIGGGLGAAIGIGGAIFGTMASLRRARIAAKLHELQTRQKTSA